ncbi:unnamed protein product [Rhizophagus irregularis]|nr:unnamed protein product [Rhizophagus irregularis]
MSIQLTSISLLNFIRVGDSICTFFFARRVFDIILSGVVSVSLLLEKCSSGIIQPTLIYKKPFFPFTWIKKTEMSEPTVHATSDLVYIFIDYSNVVHEGSRELSFPNESFNVDINRLVTTVRNERNLGGVFIAGSTPTPAKDELAWRRAEHHHGFNVETFPRNALNKEEGVDVHLACEMMEVILTKTPGTLILITGDSDFSEPVNQAKEKKWEVEIWSWPKGMAKIFKSFPYVSLKVHYLSFVYIARKHPLKDKFALKISGNIIKSWKWKDGPIMEYYFTRKLLCQFYWINDTTAHLYFKREDQLQDASNWWKSKDYPDMLVEKLGKDIKNDKMLHEGNHTNIQDNITSSTPQTVSTSPKEELSRERIEDLGLNVKTFSQKALNKEKGADVHLACRIMDVIYAENPCTLILITDGANFSTAIKKAKEKKWKVEKCSWPKGMARDHYRSFAYVTGTYPLKSKYVLKISGDIIKDRRRRNEPIMEYYFTHNLLCQFYWIDDTIAHLYFNSKNQLQHASNWWKSNYPNIEKLGKDIKNDKLPHEGNHTNTQNKTGHITFTPPPPANICHCPNNTLIIL